MNATKLRQFILFILLCGLVCIETTRVAAQQGNFLVTLSRFKVNRQTNEGLRAMDGAGDEVKFITHVGTLNAAGAFSYGEVSSLTIRNLVTSPDEFQTMSPLTLFNGEIGQDTKAVVIIPTIWEMDDLYNLQLMPDYRADIGRSRTALTRELAAIIRDRPALQLSKFLLSGSMLGINLNTMKKLARGIPQDRPIGMQAAGINQFGFMP